MYQCAIEIQNCQLAARLVGNKFSAQNCLSLQMGNLHDIHTRAERIVLNSNVDFRINDLAIESSARNDRAWVSFADKNIAVGNDQEIDINGQLSGWKSVCYACCA